MPGLSANRLASNTPQAATTTTAQFPANDQQRDELDRPSILTCAQKNLRELTYVETDDEQRELEGKITQCVRILDEKSSLIIIFNANDHRRTLKDAIADALLESILTRRYRPNQERDSAKFFQDQYSLKAEELKWCTVSMATSTQQFNSIVSLQIWDKVEHAKDEFLLTEDDDDVMRQTKTLMVKSTSIVLQTNSRCLQINCTESDDVEESSI